MGKRILFREVPGKGRRIQANITEDEIYYGHSISPFKPFDECKGDLEFILGVVNSKLVSWYGNLILPNFGKDVFPKLNPSDIKELPIPNAVMEAKSSLSKFVVGILEAKTQNHSSETSDLENKIDKLVYQLYNLTDEEIEIIETI